MKSHTFYQKIPLFIKKVPPFYKKLHITSPEKIPTPQISLYKKKLNFRK